MVVAWSFCGVVVGGGGNLRIEILVRGEALWLIICDGKHCLTIIDIIYNMTI